MRYLFSALLVVLVFAKTGSTQPVEPSTAPGDRWIAEYFRAETQKLTDRTFADIETLEDWTSKRPEYRRQMLEMLGLDPMPPKTPLEPVVTGTLEASGVIVERLHFQSMPGLYVTANLYRPSVQDDKLPAILYVCGHGGERHDGKSLGNKTHYQHHGAWFARNGYVCLTIDTVQLGEIEGIHHGTYREKMWWWNNRGYSSAGVEAFNCIRSLDYLQSRDEVDGDRIGVTGRSGGGAYSWWIAAIDERITAAVPVAGITSLKNHVVDGCVEGHCDCMYMVNTYRWDFPMVAALVAPRPLLITNSDKDRIFPLDGVVDVYAKVQTIYDLYDARDKLGLQISEGPHKDTQELRVAAFRWMNRFLRDDQTLIEMAAEPLFEKRDLKVFEELPEEQRVTTIHESFVPKADSGALDTDSPEAVRALIDRLRQRTFRGWPDSPESLDVQSIVTNAPSSDTRVIEFTSQSPFRLPIYVVQPDQAPNAPLDVVILDQDGWKKWAAGLAVLFPDHVPGAKPDSEVAKALRQMTTDRNTAFLVPRGIGPTRWTDDERTQTHIRRRFMLLGQTLAGMQIYDVIRGLETLRQTPGLEKPMVSIKAEGDAAFWGLYASLFVDGIDQLKLENLPKRNRDAPDLLNVSRFVELEDVVEAATTRLVKE
ncbi:Acetyl xylan esterase (AXE1) [Stieleria neptunia]|uniref:Acetyl xylan esterase (AXE1) n=1 Tax=Stieleria neptunia TaxID=2527979 RepID=A0A518HP87_9BACT|nr:acetylxylan esterase [Stieleria neptunia]QDV42641.1 Acetyl xylan esterase (AXE1) [Stieleria neptunia]